MYERTRYGASHDGHDVELEFDTRRVIINKAVLRVDGEDVDSTRIFYGSDELRTTLADGAEITVKVHSGMAGELTRAQLRRPDGSWVDLSERS